MEQNEVMKTNEELGITFAKQLIVVCIFIGTLLLGLVAYPLLMKAEVIDLSYNYLPAEGESVDYSAITGLPVELVMIIAAIIIASFILATTKLKWNDLQTKMIKAVSDALPGMLLLLLIGLVIGTFIACGLMPMLIYYGVKIVSVKFIYAISFLLALVFSTFTGTSWGSAATIGVVMMSIGIAIDANLAILAGAIIGGSYFGDKMSPLSDTTNIAAIASEVDLYSHIGSMMYTTIPSSIIALVVYTIIGLVTAPSGVSATSPETTALLNDLEGLFNFNPLLLIPIIIVFYGSYKKMPTYPVMAVGAASAFFLTLIFQDFTFADNLTVLHSGYNTAMSHDYTITSEQVSGIVNRGGFTTLSGLLPITATILCVVGIMSSIDALPSVVNKIFRGVKNTAAIVISSLWTAIFLIGATSNGIACSFVTADIYKEKYDSANIHRRVLSRTTEDAGTLLEVLFPWTPAAIFFTATLGVSTIEYAPWAIMNWVTPIIAMILAATGFGIFNSDGTKKWKKNQK